MEETLENVNTPSEFKVSDAGGIRLRLRDRDLLKKRKAEAEEKATNQAQSIKRARKSTSGTPGKKGRPRKEQPIVEEQPKIEEQAIPEDLCEVQETDPSPATLPNTQPVLPNEPETVTLPPAEPQPELVPVDTISDKPLEGFLIEDLGPDEEDRPIPQNRLDIDTGDVPEQSQVSIPMFPPAPAIPTFPPASAPYPDSLPENLL
ncbi:magnetosome-associated protein MamJ isoform X2 [Myxocyprinus asiaticus]|uniref:magnetosome-associated protein MamJ isoform X2 n=1 Tax=Myxocyprinus asiaticus TaxID=70543 RepID=UPI002221BAF9|nr:magnetosome-associated protein MamJ isoform X2 [Myxocyprinus asiaticus]